MPFPTVTLWASLLAVAGPEPWLTSSGAGDLDWGTSALPLESTPRDRSAYLPDAGFIGSRPGDKPTDLNVSLHSVDGEQRFVRYVHGELVDAWQARTRPLDVRIWSRGAEQWSGTVLGPGSDGWHAFGDATSWSDGKRTALHWRDRTSELEILAVRTISATSYKAVRSAPLTNDAPPPTHSARVRGDLRVLLRSVSEPLSGCLNRADKPVVAKLGLRFDEKGNPGQIRVDTDKVAPDVVDCMAGVVADIEGPPGLESSLTLQRIH